jgi:D-sedoheptulose 7-phosphate isomerase
VIDALLETRDRGGHIYTLGNGGSAATAAHFANDLVVSVRAEGAPFRAVCLSANVPVLTAVSNDYGYDQVFVHQLRGRIDQDDLVIAFSASGNSPNVVAAVEYAATCGATTIGFSAFDGGVLRERARVCVHVPTFRGEYGPAEDAHLALEHMLTAWLAHTLRSRSSGA